MAKKTRRQPSPEPTPPGAADITFPGDVLDVAEAVTRSFREFLDDFLARELSDAHRRSDWMRFVGTGALLSVLRMIEEEGECPLSAAQFWRIVGQSSFKKVLCAEEPEPQEPTAAAAEGWEMRNERRLALIRRSLSEELTPGEEADLRQLQADLEKRLESQDERLLGALARMKRAVQQLPDEP